MGALLRLARWLGKDTVSEVTRTEPLYEYTIEQTNGRTVTKRANRLVREEGTVRLRLYKEPYPACVFHTSLWLHESTVFEAGAATILSIEREKVADIEFVAQIDAADCTMVEWETREKYE